MDNDNEQNTFDCPRCKYTTPFRSILIRHLCKKKSCDPIYSSVPCQEILKHLEKQKEKDTNIVCVWCNKKFNHKSNLYAHTKVCKAKNEPQTSNIESSTNNNILISNSNVEELLKTMITLMQHRQDQPTIVNNYNTTNNVQNNIINQVNINAFGKEKLDHITKEFLTTCLINNDVIEIVKQINFNPNVPENHNVKRITSSQDYYKNQFLATFEEDGTWKRKFKEDVLSSILNKGFKAMMDHMISLINANDISVEDSARLHTWIRESFANPKKFLKRVFAETLNDELFLIKAES